MKFLLVIIFSFTTALATEQLILTSTNDIDRKITKTFVQLDDRFDAQALLHVTYNKGLIVDSIHITPKLAQNWIILDKKFGRVIAKLKSEKFSSANGGVSTISYLANGITNSWRSVEFDLRRNGDDWVAYHNGDKVTQIKFYGRRIPIVGAIGIKKVIFK